VSDGIVEVVPPNVDEAIAVEEPIETVAEVFVAKTMLAVDDAEIIFPPSNANVDEADEPEPTADPLK
jgi:hypothetical protein